MQTLRKLPTILPKTKNTTDQKWKGTAAQTAGSKVRDMGKACSVFRVP
jgi:hypothetical protein